MFQELVDGLRLLVGAHGAHGCSVYTATRALREVLLPQCRMQPNETLVTTTLEMIRSDAHITCFQFLAAADRTDMTGISDGSPGSVGPAPTNWAERAWADPLLQQALFLQPSRTLQAYVLGIDSGCFMGPSSWAIVDLLGQAMVHGASREALRAAAVEVDNATVFHLSMKRLTLWELIGSAAVIVYSGGHASAFQERFFLRIANPGGRNSTASTFLGAWLERERSTHPSIDGTSGDGDEVLGDAADDDDDEDDVIKIENDDDDVPLGILLPLRSVRGQQLVMPIVADNNALGTPPATAGSTYPTAVEDSVVERMIRSHGGSMTIRLLTKQLMRYYRVAPDGKRRFDASRTAIAHGCLQQLANLEVYTHTTHEGNKQATVVLVSDGTLETSNTHYAHETSDDGQPISSTAPVAAVDAANCPRSFSFFPLLPLEKQIVQAAHDAPVIIEDTRPSFCQRNMKHLVSRVKAIAASPTHVGAVEVSMQRSAKCKSFTTVVRPRRQPLHDNATGGPREHQQPSVGVSEWAREVVVGLISNSEYGVVVLDAIPLDIRTLKRLIPVLRSEGTIATSGIQLSLRGKRYGLILDATRVATITDAQKLCVVEAYVAATATKHPRPTTKTERNDAPDFVMKSERDNPALQPKRHRVDGVASPHATWSVKQALIDKTRATVASVGNGLATAHTARCWRLHLELWVVVLRLRSAKKVYWSSELSCTLGQLLEEMSLSTFCVVVGFNADDVVTYMYDGAQIPWGAPIRQLAPRLRMACAAHGAGYLMAALRSLCDCGAVLTSDGAVSTTPVIASTRTLDRALKIVLATEIQTADGRCWPMLGTHPTEVLANVSLFWGTHVVTSPLTTMPNINVKRLMPLCEVVANSPLLSLAEIAVLSDYFRVSLPSMAQLALRWRGDMVHMSPAAMPTSASTDSHLRRALRNRPHPAVVALLASGDATATEQDVGDAPPVEGDVTDGRHDEQRKLLMIRHQLDSQHVLKALRLAVLDDNFFVVLKRIQHILKKDTPYSGVLECLLPMLRRLRDYVDAHAIAPSTFRDMRAEMLESLVAPCGPANVPQSSDPAANELHRLRFESITAAYVPTIDNGRSLALQVVHENEGLADTIRCILFSRWDAIDSESRDNLLAPFPPERVPVVCHALRRAFMYAFALPKDMGGEDGRRHLQGRMQMLISTGRCLYGHIPVRFSPQSLAESVVVRQASAIAFHGEPQLDVVVGEGAHDHPMASLGTTALVRQAIVDLQALGGSASDRTLDGMHVPVLRYPDSWMSGVGLRAAVPQPTALSGSAPSELRYREPAAWSWRHPPRNEVIAEDCLLRYVPEDARDILVPCELHGTPLCQANGQLNLLVASVECARVRAFLLGAPGMSRRALCAAMAGDGILSSRVATFVVQLLERSGYVAAERRPNVIAHRRVFPQKRPREELPSDHTAECDNDAMRWVLGRCPDSISTRPLDLFRSAPLGGRASGPAVVHVSAL